MRFQSTRKGEMVDEQMVARYVGCGAGGRDAGGLLGRVRRFGGHGDGRQPVDSFHHHSVRRERKFADGSGCRNVEPVRFDGDGRSGGIVRFGQFDRRSGRGGIVLGRFEGGSRHYAAGSDRRRDSPGFRGAGRWHEHEIIRSFGYGRIPDKGERLFFVRPFAVQPSKNGGSGRIL